MELVTESHYELYNMTPKELQLSAGQVLITWGPDNVIKKEELITSDKTIFVNDIFFVGTRKEVDDLIINFKLTKKQ